MMPDPVFWKDGEEVSYKVGSYNLTQVRNITKTGGLSCIKMGAKNLIIKVIFPIYNCLK